MRLCSDVEAVAARTGVVVTPNQQVLYTTQVLSRDGWPCRRDIVGQHDGRGALRMLRN